MSDLELLKRYLQNEIDTGSHKIFVFDKDYNAIEFKIIEALNEINNLQSQLQQKENIIKEDKELLEKIYKILPSTYNQLLIEIKQILEKVGEE